MGRWEIKSGAFIGSVDECKLEDDLVRRLWIADSLERELAGGDLQLGFVGFEVEFIGTFKSFFRALHKKTAFDQARRGKELVGLTGA